MRQLAHLVYNIDSIKENCKDSRGIELCKGDKVLVFLQNVGVRKIYLGIVGENGLETYSVYKSNSHTKGKEPGYAFKVDFDVQEYEEYAKKVLSDRKLARTKYLYDVNGVVAEKLRKNLSDNGETMVLDYFGRRLKAGSFVYYMKNNELMSGVLVSSSQVLNRHLKIEKVGGVLLINKLLEDEELERQELNRYLNKSMQKVKKDEFGDIMICGSTAYVYLDNFSFQCRTDHGSFRDTVRKGLWLCFVDDISVVDRDALLYTQALQHDLLFNALTKSVVYANSRENFNTVTKYDVSSSWLLDDMKCFKSKRPGGWIAGTMKFDNTLYMSREVMDRYGIGHSISYEFKFGAIT